MKKTYPPEWLHMAYIQTNIRYSPAGEISENGCFTFYWDSYLYVGDTMSEVIQQFYEEFEDDKHLVG